MTLKIEALTADEEESLSKLFKRDFRGEFVRVNGCFVVPRSADLARIKNMSIFPDDIFIVTPPKCGTTWTQEIVWLMKNAGDEKAAQINQFYRVPFLELGSIRRSILSEDPGYPEGADFNEENVTRFMLYSEDFVDKMKRPRIIKTHLPLSLLPDKLLETCKVVFVARNIKDACVSYFYHHSLLFGREVLDNFALFARLFKSGILMQTPMMDMILEAWALRQEQNLHFLTYEDLQEDFSSAVAKIAAHLDQAMSDEQMAKLKEKVAFRNMKDNIFVNKSKEIRQESDGPKFMRSGKVGDWKNHFDSVTNREWDEWISEKLKGTGMKMVFEL